MVENEARDEKIEVATEEEVRAGADDHCTEQDEKVRVGADKSEARDGRFNTDADADNSTLESRGRTISRGTENPNRTTRGDEENTGGVVTEDGKVSGQGGAALISRKQSDDSLAPKYEERVVTSSAE